MNLTEKEAGERWCPFGRYLATFRNEYGKLDCAGSYNRGAEDSGLASSNCLGSKCMAWRWHDGEIETCEVVTELTVGTDTWASIKPEHLAEVLAAGFVRHPGGSYRINRSHNAQRLELYTRPFAERRTGFCGLAEPRIVEVSVNQ